MKPFKIISSLFILVILIASCSSSKVVGNGFLQKRKYNKGFHISLKKSNKNSHSTNKLAVIDLDTFETEPLTASNDQEPATESNPAVQKELKKLPLIANKAKEKTTNKKELLNHEGDTVKVTLKDGSVYSGKISKKNEKGFFLTMENEREIFINKNEIHEIKNVKTNAETTYEESGEEQSYSHSTDSYVAQENKPELPEISKIAKVLMYIGLFQPVLLLIAIILAAVGRNKAKRNPKYDYKAAKKVLKNTLLALLIMFLVYIVLGFLFIYLMFII